MNVRLIARIPRKRVHRIRQQSLEAVLHVMMCQGRGAPETWLARKSFNASRGYRLIVTAAPWLDKPAMAPSSQSAHAFL
jgi:hypothetical protein